MENSIKLNTGYYIPFLGLGTWNLRGKDCQKSIKFAINRGYQLIDTASMYGNEEEIGIALHELLFLGQTKRENIFVTTKIWSSDLGKTKSQTAIEHSLSLLKIDYIDLHLIHWPGSSKKARLEAYGVLLEYKNSGKIRTIGVSNFSISQIEELIEEYNDVPSVNQIRMNPFSYDHDLIDYCMKKGIVVTAYSPLTQGHSMNHPTLIKTAKKYNKTVAQLLLRWCIEHNAVVIPKSSKKERIIENSLLFDFEITNNDMEVLNALS